ncbi:PREDICTED: uncharacterized mitochondrial protein AtMg00310 [Erythranthe guttata]|uniref:uncharacterized mitochondrial protein AtMg00310 n=1 Tax=Erythranthe guttata TaxID=4155 RepID=UPI00064DAF76|nr:PREDICTED: uncharacterized mitochondrial protein AtMg00310 [Erythranthe guttata]|eukprot:XP_012849447.1 PREDICTED: uncharacterized mitochondrial protein AtMg00310 [Erythranthe guttata]
MPCFVQPHGLINDIEAAIRRFWLGSGDGKPLAWISWTKLCRPKEVEGIGFRDLKAFNLVLLAKQAWRILTYPDLLLSQILKARYFPSGDIWTATPGYRPSATCRSILAARSQLRACIRIHIGNGSSTAIWGDPWLLGEGKPVIFTPRPVYSSFPNSVSDIVDRNT